MPQRNPLPTSFRLSEKARELLGAVAEREGLSLTSALEVLIREGARKRGVK